MGRNDAGVNFYLQHLGARRGHKLHCRRRFGVDRSRSIFDKRNQGSQTFRCVWSRCGPRDVYLDSDDARLCRPWLRGVPPRWKGPPPPCLGLKSSQGMLRGKPPSGGTHRAGVAVRVTSALGRMAGVAARTNRRVSAESSRVANSSRISQKGDRSKSSPASFFSF